MALNFTNYHKKGSLTGIVPDEVQVLTGVSGGTIVKSLQISTGNESCYVTIIRKDDNGSVYSQIKIEMKANDYLILWQGFFVIPYLHKLTFTSDSNYCTVVANVVQMG